MMRFYALCLIGFAYVMVVAISTEPAFTQNADGTSGLQIPRFVSIKAAVANARRGPGDEFPILWQYRRASLPLEVIDEYKGWRRVRDHLGDESWMKHWLLSGKRYVIVAARNPVPLYRHALSDAKVRSYLRPNLIAELKECIPLWCEIDVSHPEFSGDGWIERTQIWGADHADAP